MAKKYVFGAVDYAELRKELKGMGFCFIPEEKTQEDIRHFKLRKTGRRQKGPEVGFEFSAKGLTVKVWTTWLRKEWRARENDSAWVLICNGDKSLYFNRPIHRTKNFIRNLLRQAWIAKWRVENRPHCSDCGAFMNIVPGRSLKSKYWRCDQLDVHKNHKPVFLSWDKNLPPKAMKVVQASRKRRTRYRKQRKAEGKPINVALLKRRGWKKEE